MQWRKHKGRGAQAVKGLEKKERKHGPPGTLPEGRSGTGPPIGRSPGEVPRVNTPRPAAAGAVSELSHGVSGPSDEQNLLPLSSPLQIHKIRARMLAENGAELEGVFRQTHSGKGPVPSGGPQGQGQGIPEE